MKKFQQIRQDFKLPPCLASWGWEYHHIGIPTKRKMPDEKYLPDLKFYVSGFSTSPFGIEWMRFDADCPLPELIQTVPHIAFEVENIDEELSKHDFTILSEPDSPSAGVRTAMIKHNAAPIELIEFKGNKNEK